MNVSLLPLGEPGDLGLTLDSVGHLVVQCQERLQPSDTHLHELAAVSAAKKQAFLAEMDAVDAIPPNPQRCQQVALTALASGLEAGVLDATVAVARHHHPDRSGDFPRPSIVSELLRCGATTMRSRGVRQKRAAREMVATSMTFHLLAAVMSARAWRDFVSTVFALGYGIATTDAALILLANQAPAAED